VVQFFHASLVLSRRIMLAEIDNPVGLF
jgi:hypothetical protein